MEDWELFLSLSQPSQMKCTLFSFTRLFIRGEKEERERVWIDETVPVHNLFIHSHSSDTCTHTQTHSSKLELSGDILFFRWSQNFRKLFSFLLFFSSSCVYLSNVCKKGQSITECLIIYTLKLKVLCWIDFFTFNYLASLIQLSEMYNLYVDQWIAIQVWTEWISSSSYSLVRRKHIDWHLNLLNHLSMHAG